MSDPYSYDPAVFFDSFYRTTSGDDHGLLIDQQTVGDLPARFIRHHYNSLENLIMESLGDNLPLHVLDFGAGAGHWTDFAFDALGAVHTDQVDLSPRAIESLGWKYCINPVDQYDRLFKTFGRTYNAVFAIGVMFHIVQDAKWASTLAALIRRLSPDGYLFCSGSFVGETRDVQYHVRDEFKNWGECYWNGERKRVHKRLRSFEDWRAVVENSGGVITTRWFNRAPQSYIVPENNLLVIQKRK